jgi:hypothetical protein
MRLCLWTVATSGPSFHLFKFLFVHQSALEILQAEPSSSKQEEQVVEMMNLALWSIFIDTSQVIFYMP